MSSYCLLAHTAANAISGGTFSTTTDNTFSKMTVNANVTDSTTMVTLSASNVWTHAATGTYQIDGVVGFGYSDTLNGVSFKAGLYNFTTSAFVPNVGGSIEIIGSAGVAPDPVSTGQATGFINLCGRYTVSSTTDNYGIRGAGKCGSTAATWAAQTFAQGSPASGVTTGTKLEYYKQIVLIKE